MHGANRKLAESRHLLRVFQRLRGSARLREQLREYFDGRLNLLIFDDPRFCFFAAMGFFSGGAIFKSSMIPSNSSLSASGTPASFKAFDAAFAIKAEVCDPRAKTFAFTAQKTMYGGKHIAEGDTVFVFASENEGGQGLIARGVVTSAEAIAKERGIARQTPRVSLTIRRTALAKGPMGRSELKHFTDWNDGQPETELNFKFYRQATNKIVGISDEAAAFLNEFV